MGFSQLNLNIAGYILTPYIYIYINPCLADCPINASIYGGSPSLPCCHVWVPKGDHNDSLLHIVIVNHCNLLFFINESLMIATYHILVGYSHTGSSFQYLINITNQIAILQFGCTLIIWQILYSCINQLQPIHLSTNYGNYLLFLATPKQMSEQPGHMKQISSWKHGSAFIAGLLWSSINKLYTNWKQFVHFITKYLTNYTTKYVLNI